MPLPVKDVAFQTTPIPAVAPTGLTVSVQTSPTLVAATDTQLLAANASRRVLNITNLTGATLYLAFGGVVADATTFAIAAGAAWNFCVTNDYKMLLSEIRAFSVLGGEVGVLELT